MTTVPHWATSIIQNYRMAFIAAYGVEFPGTDADVYRIQKDEPVWPSGEEQDEAVVWSMRDFAFPEAA